MKPIPQLTKSDLTRFWVKVDMKGPDECWKWLAYRCKDGYGRFDLCQSPFRAHRISFAIANGDPGELNVNHTCDNPRCVNPGHLWKGTMQDGMTDKVIKKRQSSTLGEHQIREILLSTETCQILADRLGVKHQNISAIRRGERWKHLGGGRQSWASKTGSRGVTFHKGAGRYRADVTIKKNRYYLGLFDTIEEATTAIATKKKELR